MGGNTRWGEEVKSLQYCGEMDGFGVRGLCLLRVDRIKRLGQLILLAIQIEDFNGSHGE